MQPSSSHVHVAANAAGRLCVALSGSDLLRCPHRQHWVPLLARLPVQDVCICHEAATTALREATLAAVAPQALATSGRSPLRSSQQAHVLADPLNLAGGMWLALVKATLAPTGPPFALTIFNVQL